MIFTGKHPCWVSFLIRLQAISPVTLKETPAQIFFMNIGKFIITPVLKNICKRLHFWKVFCKNIFQIRTWQRELLMKQEWSPVLWKVAQISQDWTKMFPIIKHKVKRENIEFLHKMQNRIKSRKYFSTHQYQNFRKFQH